jgi:hypothetical protein
MWREGGFPEGGSPEDGPPEDGSPEGDSPPVSEPPVSEPKVSEPPVSEPPVSKPPVSEPPVSKPPVSIEDFPNLGGDAHLIVPHPPTAGGQSNHVHLASFVRHASDQQIQQLWQRCAESVERLVGQRPIWLNTAGDGVAWLHIRVDQRPKYYHYKPYTQN